MEHIADIIHDITAELDSASEWFDGEPEDMSDKEWEEVAENFRGVIASATRALHLAEQQRASA